MVDFPTRSPSWRYADIYKKYYASKAKEQQKFLIKTAHQFLTPKQYLREVNLYEKLIKIIKLDDFKDYFPPRYGINAVISPFHVERLSRAYFIDIIR